MIKRSLVFFRFAWQERSLIVVRTFESVWNEMNACMNEWLNVLDGMRCLWMMTYHCRWSITCWCWWWRHAAWEGCSFLRATIHIPSTTTRSMSSTAFEMPWYVLNLMKNVGMFFTQILSISFKLIQVVLSRMIKLRKKEKSLFWLCVNLWLSLSRWLLSASVNFQPRF